MLRPLAENSVIACIAFHCRLVCPLCFTLIISCLPQWWCLLNSKAPSTTLPLSPLHEKSNSNGGEEGRDNIKYPRRCIRVCGRGLLVPIRNPFLPPFSPFPLYHDVEV